MLCDPIHHSSWKGIGRGGLSSGWSPRPLLTTDGNDPLFHGRNQLGRENRVPWETSTEKARLAITVLFGRTSNAQAWHRLKIGTRHAPRVLVSHAVGAMCVADVNSLVFVSQSCDQRWVILFALLSRRVHLGDPRAPRSQRLVN